jgi:hypothetical protein
MKNKIRSNKKRRDKTIKKRNKKRNKGHSNNVKSIRNNKKKFSKRRSRRKKGSKIVKRNRLRGGMSVSKLVGLPVEWRENRENFIKSLGLQYFSDLSELPDPEQLQSISEDTKPETIGDLQREMSNTPTLNWGVNVVVKKRFSSKKLQAMSDNEINDIQLMDKIGSGSIADVYRCSVDT